VSYARHKPRLDRARRTSAPPVAACIVPAADAPDDDDAPEEVAVTPGSLAAEVAQALARERARAGWRITVPAYNPDAAPKVAPAPVKRHKPGSTRHLANYQNPVTRQERGNDGQH
jgi:hypothetical protein